MRVIWIIGFGVVIAETNSALGRALGQVPSPLPDGGIDPPGPENWTKFACAETASRAARREVVRIVFMVVGDRLRFEGRRSARIAREVCLRDRRRFHALSRRAPARASVAS
jgi:hypothetical protein